MANDLGEIGSWLQTPTQTGRPNRVPVAPTVEEPFDRAQYYKKTIKDPEALDYIVQHIGDFYGSPPGLAESVARVRIARDKLAKEKVDYPKPPSNIVDLIRTKTSPVSVVKQGVSNVLHKGSTIMEAADPNIPKSNPMSYLQTAWRNDPGVLFGGVAGPKTGKALLKAMSGAGNELDALTESVAQKWGKNIAGRKNLIQRARVAKYGTEAINDIALSADDLKDSWAQLDNFSDLPPSIQDDIKKFITNEAKTVPPVDAVTTPGGISGAGGAAKTPTPSISLSSIPGFEDSWIQSRADNTVVIIRGDRAGTVLHSFTPEQASRYVAAESLSDAERYPIQQGIKAEVVQDIYNKVYGATKEPFTKKAPVEAPKLATDIGGTIPLAQAEINRLANAASKDVDLEQLVKEVSAEADVERVGDLKSPTYKQLVVLGVDKADIKKMTQSQAEAFIASTVKVSKQNPVEHAAFVQERLTQAAQELKRVREGEKGLARKKLLKREVRQLSKEAEKLGIEPKPAAVVPPVKTVGQIATPPTVAPKPAGQNVQALIDSVKAKARAVKESVPKPAVTRAAMPDVSAAWDRLKISDKRNIAAKAGVNLDKWVSWKSIGLHLGEENQRKLLTEWKPEQKIIDNGRIAAMKPGDKTIKKTAPVMAPVPPAKYNSATTGKKVVSPQAQEVVATQPIRQVQSMSTPTSASYDMGAFNADTRSAVREAELGAAPNTFFEGTMPRTEPTPEDIMYEAARPAHQRGVPDAELMDTSSDPLQVMRDAMIPEDADPLDIMHNTVPQKWSPVQKIYAAASGPPPKPPVGLVPSQKLWLPEPPRNIPNFIKSMKSEVKSKWRNLTSDMEVVESARALVYKAQDLGQNARNWVSSYLHGAGDIDKEFGLVDGVSLKGAPINKNMATNVTAKTPGASMAINDILSNPTHYNLTAKQTEIAARYGEVYREGLKLAKSYGVDIKELGGPDEFYQYIARRVEAQIDPTTGRVIKPQPTIGGRMMGAPMGNMKERVFDEILQGMNTGYIYKNPQETVSAYLTGLYRVIGNKQAQDILEPLMNVNGLSFANQPVRNSVLKGLKAPRDISEAISSVFEVERPFGALKWTADFNSSLVGQIASLDVSAPFIQGLPLIGHDLYNWMTGHPSNLWADAYGKMWKTVKNPDSIRVFRERNADLYKRAMEYGVQIGEGEMVAGVGTTEKLLREVPVAGQVMGNVYRESWGRMGQAYSDFLEIGRIKLFEQMEPQWVANGRNLNDLGQLVNRMTGTSSPILRGVGVNRRLLERSAAFAPNYMRSSFLLLGDLVKGKATAGEAQKALATLLGVGAMVYIAEEKIRGREPKLKPWPTTVGGDGAAAFTTEVNGVRVGLGSWMYGLIKLAFEVGALAVDDPGQLVRWDSTNPVAKFAKSKVGAGPSLVAELASQRNFYGQPFSSGKDWAMRLMAGFTPITLQTMIEPESVARKRPTSYLLTTAATQASGLRTYPESLKNEWAEAGYFDAYNAIPKDDNERVALGLPYSRAQYLEKNPAIDARMFVSEQTKSINSWATADEVYNLIKADRLDASSIAGIQQALKDYSKNDKYNVPRALNNTDVLVYKLQKEGILKASKDKQAISRGQDLAKIMTWKETLKDVTNKDAYAALTNMMRAKDPDLDTALVWAKIKTAPMSGLTYAQIEKRQAGDYSGIVGGAADTADVLRMKDSIVKYYSIEDQVWQNFSPGARVLSDQVTKLLATGTPYDKARAKALAYSDPQILIARQRITNLKKVALQNKQLALALRSFAA